MVIHEEGVIKNADKTDAANEGGLGQMPTLDDKEGRGVGKLLTMADKGGRGGLHPLLFG